MKMVHVTINTADLEKSLKFYQGIDEEEARRYDDALEEMKREYRTSQEEFYIMSQSFLE